jgi:hypothetical protein
MLLTLLVIPHGSGSCIALCLRQMAMCAISSPPTRPTASFDNNVIVIHHIPHLPFDPVHVGDATQSLEMKD